jgi:hypothetical protein
MESWLEFEAEKRSFLFSESSRQTLGPTQLPNWVSSAISPRIKRPGREAGYCPSGVRVITVIVSLSL